MKLVCVVGSAAKSHRTRRALDVLAAGAQAAAPAAGVDLVDLSECAVSVADGRPLAEYADRTEEVVRRVGEADCVVLATPVYRGSYTGALKNLLDHLPLEALEGKAVGLVATGASEHHYLAIDHQLRGVIAWFGAYQLPGSVYVTHREIQGEDMAPATTQRLQQLGRAVVELSGRLPRGAPLPPTLAREAVRARA